MGENGGGPGGLLTKLVANFAGLGAAILGLLYLSGLLLKWAELRRADVSIRDVLPLYPLEQILGTGLALVAPALAGILVMGALIGAAHALEKKVEVLSARFKRTRVKELPATERQTWAADYQRLIEEKSWDAQASEVRQALREARRGASRERIRELRRTRRWFAADSAMAYSFGGVMTVAYWVLVPALVAIPVLLVAMGVLLSSHGPERPMYQLVAMNYAIFVAALVVGTLAYPRDLPPAQVVTDNEGIVEGDLVLKTDSSWYLTSTDGVIRTIRDAHVECARIEKSPRRGRSVVRLALDDVDPPEEQRELPDLDCKTPSGG